MSAAGHVVRSGLHALDRGRRSGRRQLLALRIRTAAWRVGATVDVTLPDDLLVGRDVTVVVAPGSHSTVRFGSGCSLGDRLLLQLKGGELLAGDRVELRKDVVINLAGRLELRGDNLVSWGAVLHVSNDVVLEEQAIFGEYLTVADSSHYFTTPDDHVWHNVRTGSVRVGRNTWVCPKVTLARGADVGSHCIVGSNSVVTASVPDGHLASGVPATVRPLPLPWQQDPEAVGG